MDILDNIGRKVAEAAQMVTKKSGELIEVGKINVNISSEEDKIRKYYEQIGKLVYNLYTSGEDLPSEIADICVKIRTSEETIKELKQKLLELKNMKACENCGANVEKTAVYCSKCGAKL